MRWIDTHAHLYSEELKPDLDGIVSRAQLEGIEKIYMPAIDSSCIQDMLALEKNYPQLCIAMMGLHPCYVKENYLAELNVVEQWLSKRKFCAIGEIGLDYYWDKTFVKQQQEAFELQMQWALNYNLPICIHTRNAMGETIEAVKPFAKKGLRGIFHCFSGSKESATQIIEMGFHLGLGGVLTYKNAGVAEAIKDIPMEWLVLETDAPYLAPVPYRGKQNEPSYMIEVAKKLADIKKLPLHEISEATSRNAEGIFKL
ncbi:MAG: TatD family deoxyribonuclease [Chitinophagia bacterium]|jgi:TatD DNase family protein|nr:TatD family deoxyribonuclease [Chitinophagia bacterium]